MEIMKSPLCFSRIKFLFICGSIIAPSIAIASDVVLHKAPPLTIEQAPAYPENLARYHFGAEVQTIPQSNSVPGLQLSSNGQDRNISAAALLCDDPTTGYQLPAGRSTILVSLANIENVQSISLLNDGAEGAITIATSNANVPANSPEWHNVANCSMSEGTVTAKVGPCETKYVRLTFNVTQAGRIAAFGVYATPALSDFTMPRPRKMSFENASTSFALINYNFTDVHAKARGLYVSSGDPKAINNMIDDQSVTAYQFAPGDTAPTAVIDLGRERTLSRISAVYSAQPGSVDFYVLDRLPVGQPNDTAGSNDSSVQKVSNSGQTADLPINLRLGEKDFAGMKSVGSVVNTNEGRASVDFPATTGRYVILKWHPASAQAEGFSVAQVAAFGISRQGSANQESETSRRSSGNKSADGKQLADGKNILDNNDIPAEGPTEAQAPAEGPPPPLPPVPPFTFIPEVPPTSP